RRRREALAARNASVDGAGRAEAGSNSSADQPGKANAQPVLNPAEQRRQDALRRQQKAERLKPLRQAIGKIDQRLTELTTERAALEQRLTQPNLAPADIASAGKQLKAAGEEITRLEDEWLDLSGQIEAMEQAPE
ncbi:MAG: ABC transporter, partial [Burkholderiaceae bacterium]|nr:ABC transporter [Burkholderiaceae bacterium]